MPGLDDSKPPTSPMSLTHPMIIHTTLPTPECKKYVTVQIATRSTVSDVIQCVLDGLSILASTEHFDLCEVYSEFGVFPTDPDAVFENSRTLNYSEFPLIVKKNWNSTLHTNGLDRSALSESDTEDKSVAFERYRLYLTQKSDSVRAGTDVKVTWLDGLNSKVAPEDWHFEPNYRELEDIDDLVSLPVLNENVLLDELCKRFCRGRIYTYVGGILIAVNPFKYFPIYNPKYVDAYQHKKLGELPPHVFAMADAAYNRMLQGKHDQCIVISGESGSGKTESTKLILHHLTALSHKTKATVLEKTILAAGPVLEAFGNAKTCHNNNSSRFGKFTQINYRADGVVCGAILKKYLLEKSRIVSQGANERNYHVFYSMLSGASSAEVEKLNLKSPQNYHYLNQTDCYSIEGMDEVYEFARLKNAIKNIGISTATQHRMFAVLSAVLHIGNITFKKRSFPEDSVSVADESIVDIIAELLQVEKQELIQPMTMRKTITRGEEFVRQYKKDEAIATRDSMAKCLYASLFDWIVVQTNHILASRQGRKTEKKAFSIGVLDIFGFEDFDTNSFEQFCINLANENLQYYLNQHIFKLRQDEYIEEGLDWDHVDYVDNATCLNLIVGKPTGLILLLDEECSLTIGTDGSLLDKFNTHHANNTCYEMPPTKEPVFSVVHYAGKVKYKIKGFRAKNRELMRNDVVSAFKNSRMLFMRELMGSDPIAIYYWSILRHMIKAISIFKRAGNARAKGETLFEHGQSVKWASGITPPKRSKMLMNELAETELEPANQAIMRRATRVMNKRVYELAKKVQSPSKVRSGLQARRTISGGMTEFSRRGGLKQPPTVIAQFQSSLQELMDTLNNSHPFFVRCIRSNSTKAPLEFDAELVLRQLRYTGMLETVKIRQAGYPVRIFVKDFMNRFKVLMKNGTATHANDKELTEHLTSIGLDPHEFQIGANKVFMREPQYKLLREKRQKKVDDSISLIQNWYRRRLEQKQKEQEVTSAVKIQAIWREYQKQRPRQLAAKRIQEFWRSSKCWTIGELHFEGFKQSVIKIQSLWRGYKCRMEYPKVVQAKLEAKENEEISVNHDTVVIPPPTTIDEMQTTFETTNFNKPLSDFKKRVTGARTVGSPYSPRRPKSKHTENAEHIMHDVLKDTMFGEEEKSSVEKKELEIEQKTDELDVELDTTKVDIKSEAQAKAPIAKKDENIHEDISKFVLNYKPEEQVQEKNAKFVELRTRIDQESRAQKFKRRVSFTHKDKQKSNFNLRKTREAEDFEIINPDTSLFPPHLQPGTKSSTIPQTQNSLQNTSSQHTYKFANLFTLTRKSSKRETSKGDRKTSRRMSGTGENHVVKGEAELQALNNFLMKKVTDMNKPEPDRKSDSDVDVVFKHALHKYHGTLLMTCASASVGRGEEILLKFHDFINGFQETLEFVVNQGENKVSKEFLVIGGNLFRGIIEEFQKNKEKLVLSGKRRNHHKAGKRKRRRTAEFYEHKGHIYVFNNFNIRTYCEQCNAYIYDKGLVCQACTFTCHKKCYKQNTKTCKGRRPSVCGPAALFGTDLSEITSPNNPIPQAIIKLMMEIEKKGLYSLGIYRIPGLQAAVNNLKSVFTSVEAEELILEDEKHHTLASVLKLFFRQLPKPIIPQEFYDDFLRSTDLDNEAEIHSTLYELIQRFPKPNRELLERLIVHMGRVAVLEEHNKMSPNGLAIIWAPCLLRIPDDGDPLEALTQLPKQTKCIEILIDSQVKSRRAMLNDIQALHQAESTAEKHLDSIMQNEAAGDEVIDGAQWERNEDLKLLLQTEITNMGIERGRLTDALSEISPPKTLSIDSVDELGSDADINLRGSFEMLTLPDELKRQSSISNDTPSTPTSADKRRVMMGEAHDSSFEDLSCSAQPSNAQSENQAMGNH